MATTLPRPSRPSNGPPNMALPALPVSKSRRTTGGALTAPPSPSASPAPSIPRPSGTATNPTTPRSGLRAPSMNLNPPTPAAIPSIPQLKGLPTPVNGAGKTLRKSVSINSFPHPPRGEQRSSSLPPSSLVHEKTPRTARKSKLPKELASQSPYAPTTPSLLNGSGEGKSIRMSDGLISIGSPTQSRSSSAQDSYSTSATTYDEPMETQNPNSEASASALSSAISDKRSSKSEGKGNVVVSVRVRPDTSGKEQNPEGEWMVDGRKSLISYKGKEGGDHTYDNVFTTHDNNSRVYDHIAKRLVRRVMEGYHGTVFAYGMTGTGKTFSMQGTATQPGVIPLAITDIFSYIRETPSREFLLRVSYLEIYNERIHDLLSMPASGGEQEEIKLREDSKRGVYATPLKEEIVQSPTQLLRVIARGDQARRTASTQFNARSSRSHAVVQIVVESRQRLPGAAPEGNKRSGIPPGGVRVSTLSLIDLAGSEKAAESKERRQEGAHINKSLLTLGTVIAKLSEWKDKEGKGIDKEGKHLPYRDSKLTRLLQGALAGNSLVSILCTIQIGAANSAAAANSHTTETLNTLKFASRAKNSIVSHAKKAEEALGSGGEGGARVLLERYRMEIVELRQQLAAQSKNKKNSKDEAEIERDRDEEQERALELEAAERREEQMLEMQLARTALKERIDHLNRLILSSKSIGVNSSGSLSSLSQYARFSQLSLTGSVRSSMTTPSGRDSFGARDSFTARDSLGGRDSLLDRTMSVTSSSTIGRRSTGGQRLSGDGEGVPGTEEDGMGEFGDGNASLTAQNHALQADLADKNRYIATLEKRLLQARRASSSRTSVGLSAPNKAIMVGEDHSVSAVLREKDAEIADLRARLDDKDRMLAALRSAARSRDTADASADVRFSNPEVEKAMTEQTPNKGQGRRTKSVDEMNKMLEEMIQDRVESGQIVRGVRGSVRLPPAAKLDVMGEEEKQLEPLCQTTSPAVPSVWTGQSVGEAM
ncbi:Kinesin, motor domain protein [Cordyceps fumosorosea ARSEF 2679]|uniref:Kinesin-like protein n=1 Tax=Cordyceps fumosorosea (strain ARSEF 2679) TaxID=1081104 RepID=A0A162JTG1_CORFA|nr:Kinesin, motor domain protein [Cordyceps fumosorosea ARSEF 2679]OAA73532.1 Kinesin, motor domain protein [Cordyceps fumosorosea ARSEF 2679]